MRNYKITLIILLILFCFYFNLMSERVVKLYNWDGNISIKGNNFFDNFSFKNTVGDINNDGYQDIIVSAPNSDPYGRNSAGTVYVFLGKNYSEQQTFIDLSNQEADITFYGANPNDKIGTTLYCSDINGDGYDDILIGAPYATTTNGNNTGTVYLILGKTEFENAYDLSSESSFFIKINGENSNDLFGFSMIAANFCNSSKLLFISSPNASFDNNENSGIVYIIDPYDFNQGYYSLENSKK